MFKFDWRMSQTCAHTLLTLDLDEAPPSQSFLCSPGRPGGPCRGSPAPEGQLCTLSRSLGATVHNPGSFSCQLGGVRGPSPADSKSLAPLHCLVRGPRMGGCPLFLLIQAAGPDGSPTSPLCLFPGALMGRSWSRTVPPGATSNVWTRNQMPWPMERPPFLESQQPRARHSPSPLLPPQALQGRGLEL